MRVLTELLMELGLKVGAYTSPHLERCNERIAIDGAPRADDTFAAMRSAGAPVGGTRGPGAPPDRPAVRLCRG